MPGKGRTFIDDDGQVYRYNWKNKILTNVETKAVIGIEDCYAHWIEAKIGGVVK